MSDRQPWELADEQIAEIEYDAHDVCRRCEGEGRLWADGLAHYYDANRPTKACPECDGDGRVLSGDEGHAVATAAQKKLVEWLFERAIPVQYGWHCVNYKKVEAIKTALGMK